MDILVNRKTNQIVYNINREEYPNRLGYWFGASVEYIGYTNDGNKITIPAKERSRWVDGYYPGQELNDGTIVKEVKQLHKSTVIVRFDNNGDVEEYTIEGRSVEPPGG